MKTISRYIMTLALLLTAVTGAWAQDPNAVTAAEINSDLYSGWSSIDEKLLKASDLPGFQAVTENQAKSWTGVSSTGRVKLFYDFVADGNVKVVIFNNGVYDSSYEEEELTCYLIYEDIKYNGDTKYFYTTGPAPTEWELTPDETGKKWTLAEMPASNVELQVEYYAESNLFLGKEALADKTSIAVKNGETDVAFGEDGKSITTVTEGTTVTAKFTGKKVLGMKVEKKAAAPAADIVWDVTNVTDLYVEGSEMWYEKEGIMLSGNGDQVQAVWDSFNDPTMVGIAFGMFASGGFTFMAPTGKAFTKIEMTLTGSGGWEEAYVDGNLGTGWAFNAPTVTWTGSAASTVKLLTDAGYFSGAANVKSIAFYLSE